MKDFLLPNQIKTVLDRLYRNGFSAYIVGGCVRDMIMGKEPNDYDVTTSALPDEILEIFKDYKTYEIGKKFGTITVVSGQYHVEITTMRKERGYKDGRRPSDVVFTDSIMEDVARRDFTVNAMAYSMEKGFFDAFRGEKDIENKLIKAVGTAEERFKEDGLRILRALRFAACLEFDIEEKTEKAIFDCAYMIDSIAKERIREELDKLLMGKNAIRILDRYFEIFCRIIPELRPMRGFLQHSKYHFLDVWQHTLAVVGETQSDRILKIAALLHDVGKPQAYYMDNKGVGHFKGHEPIGAEKAKDILKKLKYSCDDIDKVYNLILYHRDEATKDAVWIRQTLNKMKGEQGAYRLIELMRADAMAKVPDYQNIDEFIKAKQLLREISDKKSPYLISHLAVNGNDLQEIGITGEKIGKTLTGLLGDVIKNPEINSREKLLELAKGKQLT